MDRRKSFGIVGSMVAVLVAVVGMSIVWATYTSSLTIKGSARAEGGKWSVIFKDLSSATLGNSAGVASTAKETTTPSISGATSIENFGISVKTPGDFVSYKFKIRNDGNFPAKIDSNFSVPTPTCSAVHTGSWGSSEVVAHSFENEVVALPLGFRIGDVDGIKLADSSTSGSSSTTEEDSSSEETKTDAQKVCGNLVYTLTYTSNNQAVKSGDTFAAGEEKEVMLKLAYKDSIASSDLPTSAVNISNLNITIPFIQQ